MPCSLQDLPLELRLAIFKSVEDLPSLYSFVNASKAAAITFAKCPGEIVAAVCSRLPKELQQTMRAVAVGLCEPALNIPLVQIGRYNNTESLQESRSSIDHCDLPISFLDVPLRVLRLLLELANQIHLLAASFLDTYIDRFSNLWPLIYLNLSSGQFTTEPYRGTELLETVQHKTPKIGPASWVEEYRVVRALWRLHLSCLFAVDPQQPASVGGSRTTLGSPSRRAQFDNLWGLLADWEHDEMECVKECLDFQDIVLFDRHSSAKLLSSIRIKPTILPHPPTSSVTYLWQQDITAASYASTSYYFLNHDCLTVPSSGTVPLHNSCWTHFRRLGFGIWDLERMVEMKLWWLPTAWREAIESETGTRVPLSLFSRQHVSLVWRSIEELGMMDGEVFGFETGVGRAMWSREPVSLIWRNRGSEDGE